MDGSVLFLSPPGITISAVEIQIPRSGPFSPLCSFPSDSSLSLFTTFPQLPSLPPTRVFSLSSQKPPLTVFTRHCLHWPRAQHTLDTRTVNRVCLPLKRVALLLAQLLFCPTSTVLKCFGVVWVKLELGNNFSGFGFCSLTFVDYSRVNENDDEGLNKHAVDNPEEIAAMVDMCVLFHFLFI